MAKKEIVVIGIGRFAKELIWRLNNLSNYSIVAIDKDPTKLEQLQGVKNVIVGDATNEEFIKGIGIDNADFFVIGLGQDFQSSLIIASLIKDNFKGSIIAKSVNLQHESILKRLGILDIVTPEVAAAKGTFNKIVNPLALKGKSDEYSMNEIAEGVSIARIPIIRKWEGLKIMDIAIPKDVGITLNFKRGVDPVIVTGSTILEYGDIMAIVGKDKPLIKFLNEIYKEVDREIELFKEIDWTKKNI